jgi:hypothetical protein
MASGGYLTFFASFAFGTSGFPLSDVPLDTLGAVAAGWEAALIKRVGNDVLVVGPQPQIVGVNLHEVADQLIAQHKERTNVA